MVIHFWICSIEELLDVFAHGNLKITKSPPWNHEVKWEYHQFKLPMKSPIDDCFTFPLWLDDITKAHFPQESGKPSGEDGVRLGGQTWVATIHDRLATPNGGWL